jgi:hypothetical protein
MSAADRYRGLRATHPATLLRWLRNGLLTAIVATALLYLLVATQARHQIAAADRTAHAIAQIDRASTAASDASAALKYAFEHEDVALIGAGSAFADDAAQVGTDMTLAAEGNAAGPEGDAQIQFVQGQLATCVSLADTAVLDYDDDSALGAKADSDVLSAFRAEDHRYLGKGPAIADTGGLIAAVKDLRALEQRAFRAQLDSPWLDPVCTWLLLAAPVLCALLLVGASGYVLASHFRRHISPLLGGAFLATAVVAVTVGVLGTHDERTLSTDPRAGHPVTMSAGLLLLTAALVLAHRAYAPRLAEYRWRSS